MLVRLPAAPRHLQLAGPAGPVLVPAEQAGQLLQVALPGGTVIAATRVGRQPHDAAAAGQTIFVGNELSNTVSLIRGGKQVSVEPAPLQPGGVASNGEYVVVVGVRGRKIEAYDPNGRPLGTAPVGVGPTHVRASPAGLFYVVDTEGNAVIIFRVTRSGLRQVGDVGTEPGTPYGIAIDGRRGLVYVDAHCDQPAGVLPHQGERAGPSADLAHRPPAQRRRRGRRDRHGVRGGHGREPAAAHRPRHPRQPRQLTQATAGRNGIGEAARPAAAGRS